MVENSNTNFIVQIVFFYLLVFNILYDTSMLHLTRKVLSKRLFRLFKATVYLCLTFNHLIKIRRLNTVLWFSMAYYTGLKNIRSIALGVRKA